MIRMARGFSGIWEDTQEWIYGTLPGWMTGTVKIDVPAGRDGVEELKQKLTVLVGLPEGQNVLLSARAQYALWEIMREEASQIDQMMGKSFELTDEAGEILRAYLLTLKKDLIARASALFKMTDGAFKQGIAPAIRKEWAGVAVEQTGPEVAAIWTNPGFWVFATVAIAVVILATSYVISSSIKSASSTDTLNRSLDAAIRLGRPDLITDVIGAVPKSQQGAGFPWGWAIGIGAVAVGGILLLTWASGELGGAFEKVRSSLSPRRRSLEHQPRWS